MATLHCEATLALTRAASNEVRFKLHDASKFMPVERATMKPVKRANWFNSTPREPTTVDPLWIATPEPVLIDENRFNGSSAQSRKFTAPNAPAMNCDVRKFTDRPRPSAPDKSNSQPSTRLNSPWKASGETIPVAAMFWNLSSMSPNSEPK